MASLTEQKMKKLKVIIPIAVNSPDFDSRNRSRHKISRLSRSVEIGPELNVLPFVYYFLFVILLLFVYLRLLILIVAFMICAHILFNMRWLNRLVAKCGPYVHNALLAPVVYVLGARSSSCAQCVRVCVSYVFHAGTL